MKYYVLLGALLLSFGLAPAQAQRKSKVKTKTSGVAISAANRFQPLFGGITVAEAETLMGPAFLADIDRNFASRAEASTFFANRAYEYLTENQTDTALYRFNLAWLLDQKNADAYRGLGLVTSRQPTPDQSIGLLAQGLSLAPANALIMSDLGASYLIRFEQAKKKKDLEQALALLQKAVATDPTNAVAWQQLARSYYLHEDYAQAWEAVHKGQSLSVGSLDFELIGNLLAKLPDPQGMFK